MPDDVQTAPILEPTFEETALPERPNSLLEPWQGVIEVIPADENGQIRPLGDNRILMTDSRQTPTSSGLPVPMNCCSPSPRNPSKADSKVRAMISSWSRATNAAQPALYVTD